jgi:hypothetical protein
MTITRDDIEAKAREIVGAVEETRQSAKDTAVLAGIVIAAVVGVAFLVGRRRGGSRQKTLVEVYKI